jgi:AcrR family transcriptional regulator
VVKRYRKVARAESEAATRLRILQAAVAATSSGNGFGVREIAAAAGVTVQTVYAHFGSKGALIMAVAGEVSARRGLYEGFRRVWRQPDGTAALAEMIKTTLGFWNRAWAFISFSLTTRRTDAEYAAQIQRLDDSRLADLVRITGRLHQEGILRPGLTSKTAGALVFTLTAPNAYEELVATGRMPFRAAAKLLREAALNSVVDPEAKPKALPPPAWLRPAQLPRRSD